MSSFKITLSGNTKVKNNIAIVLLQECETYVFTVPTVLYMYSTYSTYCTVQLGRCLLVLSMAGPWHQRAQAQPSVKDYATVTVTEGGVFRKLSAERDIVSGDL